MKKQERILIVEGDKQVFRLLMKHLTEVGGYAVAGVKDFADAIVEIEKPGKFDLALIDIELPDRRGDRLAQLFRDYDPTLAIILITGDEKNFEKLYLGPYADDYILKPLDTRKATKQILAIVKNAISLKKMSKHMRNRRLDILSQFDCDNAVIKLSMLPDGDVERLDGFLANGGHKIRWVVLNYPERENRKDSIIISIVTQVGCQGKCKFCKSGKKPFIRNLTADEMIGQVFHTLSGYHCSGIFEPESEQKIEVYFACEGDALFNFKNVAEAINRLAAIKGIDISFVITTIGNEKILSDNFSTIVNLPRTKWYWSIHSLVKETRECLMPATKSQDLWATRNLWYKIGVATQTQITIAYALIPGVNDRKKDKALLKHFFSDPQFVIKVSALVDDSLPKTPKVTRKQAQIFAKELNALGLEAYEVEIKGSDSDSGCGTTVVFGKTDLPKPIT